MKKFVTISYVGKGVKVILLLNKLNVFIYFISFRMEDGENSWNKIRHIDILKKKYFGSFSPSPGTPKWKLLLPIILAK